MQAGREPAEGHRPEQDPGDDLAEHRRLTQAGGDPGENRRRHPDGHEGDAQMLDDLVG
ncbi:hypothetical protein [Microbispora sp. NPDC046933]|uniref:hypothetical protein n=1 Tax=Microbispora sp. NPDC046933 TaxID=3155618 RepID=UPI0033DBFCD1